MTQKQFLKKLKTLNLPIGRLAEKNATQHGTDMDLESLRMHHALGSAFPWYDTPQGMDFWMDVFDALQFEEEEKIVNFLIIIEKEGF